jgi:hypothetical protein
MGLKRVPKIKKQAIAVKLSTELVDKLTDYIAWKNKDAAYEPETQASIIEPAIEEFIARDRKFQAHNVETMPKEKTA